MKQPRRFSEVSISEAFQFAPSVDGFFKDSEVYVKISPRRYSDRLGRVHAIGSVSARVQPAADAVCAEFEQHAARAFFGSAWADACDESGPGVGAGVEILDAMPQTLDPAAVHAARVLRMDMERQNGASIAEMLQRLEPIADGDRELSAEMFGHYSAMQAMGHGVGLGDAFGRAARELIRVPYVEFGGHSLSRDYF